MLSRIKTAPFSWARSATDFISTISRLGFPISSAKTALVLLFIIGAISSFVTCFTNLVLIPNAARSPKRSIVPPKRPAPHIISSPASRMFRSDIVTAAMPDEHATAPTPFSRVFIRFSKAATVGLLILV